MTLMLFCQSEAKKIEGYDRVSNKKKKKDKTMADQGVENGDSVFDKKTKQCPTGE